MLSSHNVTSALRRAASAPQMPAPQRKSSTRCPGSTDIPSAISRVAGRIESHASSPGLPAQRIGSPASVASNSCQV